MKGVGLSKDVQNNGLVTARFSKRFLSFIIDLMIVNIIILWPFQKIFSKYASSRQFSDFWSGTTDVLPNEIYVVVFLIFILIMLYFVFFEYYLGQSLGQMFLDIKVISLTNNSTNKTNGISLGKAFLRSCFILPIFPFYILWIIEPLHLIFYKDRFTERITNTHTIIASKSINYMSEYKLNKV